MKKEPLREPMKPAGFQPFAVKKMTNSRSTNKHSGGIFEAICEKAHSNMLLLSIAFDTSRGSMCSRPRGKTPSRKAMRRAHAPCRHPNMTRRANRIGTCGPETAQSS